MAATQIQTQVRKSLSRRFYLLQKETVAMERLLMGAGKDATHGFIKEKPWSANYDQGTRLVQMLDRQQRTAGKLKSNLVLMEATTTIGEISTTLRLYSPFKKHLGDEWNRLDHIATKICVEGAGEYQQALNALSKAKYASNIIEVTQAISIFSEVCVRSDRPPSSYMLQIRDQAQDTLSRLVALANKEISAIVPAAGFDLRRVTSVIQTYESAHTALRSLSEEPLGEEYEMLLARRAALLDAARLQVERTAKSRDLREICDAIAYCSGVKELRDEIKKLEKHRTVVLASKASVWAALCQSDDINALYDAVGLCRLCPPEDCREQLFSLRRRLETLTHIAVQAMTDALGSVDPRVIDETLERYKSYPPNSMNVWHKLSEHRRTMAVHWSRRADSLLTATELLPLQQAINVLDYLRMDEQRIALKTRLERLVPEVSAQISAAIDKSDAGAITDLLDKTAGCDELFGAELDALREQFAPIVCEARIALHELLQNESPAVLGDIDDAILAYGKIPVPSIEVFMDQLKDHRAKIAGDVKIKLEQSLSVDDVQELTQTLREFESAAVSPEWHALDQHRNHIHLRARERLSNLLGSNDIVAVGNSLDAFAGVWHSLLCPEKARPAISMHVFW
jgi:hypothetical protein